MNECRLRRREKKMEENQKQRRIEFQFALADDRADSERGDMERESSATTPTSSRRASSIVIPFQRPRENSVTPVDRQRERKSHGHRRYQY